MKKIFLYEKANGGSDKLVGRYDTVEEAQNRVIELTEDSEKSIFDFYPQEGEYEEITDRVKSYADACNVLGIEPMNEDNMKAQGFRPDEIARRKLEAITEALNEGWKPDWNDTDEYKYYPYFYINKDAKGKGTAGLSYANTDYAAANAYANVGSRLCFHDPETARYAGRTFTALYEQILIEKL